MVETSNLVGTRIREYEILEVMGEGGMGAVYRARHLYLEEERAIKVIQSRLAGDKSFIERFIREAKILVRLHHPNLVQLYEFGALGEDAFFMILELIQGESVLDRMEKSGRFPVEEALRLIRGAAAGLQNAHQNGIVHRDMSPDNLMIIKDETGKDSVKVLDFGIAKPLLEQNRTFTAINRFVGKPEYCSPEQCGMLKKGERIDHRSDIYSLAVVAYLMISGRLPFDAKTPYGYWSKHLHEAPKRLSTQCPPGEIPQALDELIERCLAKNRDDRPSTAKEVIDAITSILGEETSTAPQAVLASKGVKPGDVFAGRYLIEERLGEGTLGSAVYKAMDQMLGMRVALRMLQQEEGETSFKRFRRGVILARKVVHPNICRIFEFGEAQKMQYVVTEFLEGFPLSQLLGKKTRVPIADSITIIRQILMALQEVHRMGIVHRDIKPQNIMIGAENRAWIMDFALSRFLDAGRTSKSGSLTGTPYYMAPEQFRGESVDARSDIYSIGVVFYEMLCGTVPFSGGNLMEIVSAHLKGEPNRLRQLAPEIPVELERIVHEAMQKDAVNRYASAAAMLADLEAFMPQKAAVPRTAEEDQVVKLLSQKDYVGAISLLQQMLPPENQRLKSIHVKKSKTKAQRIKSLVRKKSLLRAEYMVDRLKQRYREDEKKLRKLTELEGLIDKEKDAQIEQYLQEAQSLLSADEPDAAMRVLQSVQTLKSDEKRTAELMKQVVAAQQKKEYEKLLGIFEEAKSFKDPADIEATMEEVLSLLNEWMKENESPEILNLSEQILAFRETMQQRNTVSFRIGEAFQQMISGNPLDAKQIAESISLANSDLGHVKEAMDRVVSSFSKQQYDAALEEIQGLKNSMSEASLEPPKEYLDQVEEAIRSKQGATIDPQAQIAEGKQLFRDGKWEDAIRTWKKAQETMPKNSSLQELIRSTEGKVKMEAVIRSQVQRDVKRVEKLMTQKRFEEAAESLRECERVFAAEFRLSDLKTKVEGLLVQIKQQGSPEKEPAKEPEKPEEKKPSKPSTRDLDRFEELFLQGKSLYNRQRWKEALALWQEAAAINPTDTNLQLWISRAREKLAGK